MLDSIRVRLRLLTLTCCFRIVGLLSLKDALTAESRVRSELRKSLAIVRTEAIAVAHRTGLPRLSKPPQRVRRDLLFIQDEFPLPPLGDVHTV